MIFNPNCYYTPTRKWKKTRQSIRLTFIMSHKGLIVKARFYRKSKECKPMTYVFTSADQYTVLAYSSMSTSHLNMWTSFTSTTFSRTVIQGITSEAIGFVQVLLPCYDRYETNCSCTWTVYLVYLKSFEP